MSEPDVDADRALDGLLRLWHEWARGAEQVARGYPSASPACGQFKPSRQYDDANGAFDCEYAERLAQAVEREVNEIPEPWRTALHLNARNVWTGNKVWASARLPQGRMALAIVVQEARNRLLTRLQHAGIL